MDLFDSLVRSYDVVESEGRPSLAESSKGHLTNSSAVLQTDSQGWLVMFQVSSNGCVELGNSTAAAVRVRFFDGDPGFFFLAPGNRVRFAGVLSPLAPLYKMLIEAAR